MATISEDYCSREVYRLLRKKGFDGEIHTTFNEEGYTQPSITLQMAMKWLRKVHNVHIELNPICCGDTEEDLEWHYGWAVKTTIFTDRWKRHNAEHISYEQAAEAAIKYCLENLI